MRATHILQKSAVRLQKLKRDFIFWWQKNNLRYGVRWRVASGAAAALLLISVVAPVALQIIAENSYKLSSVTKELTGRSDPKLAKLLTFDAKEDRHQFNKDAIKSPQSPEAGIPSELLKKSVGAPSDKKSVTYAVDLPTDMNKGITYHDTNSQVSFSLVPQFKARQGKNIDGHLVYPMSDGMQAVYTLKNNGLKEDIIVPRATKNNMTFAYDLKLPKSLEVKAIPDSGGAVGVYSADPMLFGDISFGSQDDRINVEKARENAEKTYLVFGIPAPIIKAANGKSIGNASARFELTDTTLSVVAENLKSISGPFTVDPSVVVTSTSDFQTSGNNEGNIDFSTSGQITRGGLTGGSIGAWQYTHNSASSGSFVGGFTDARSWHASVIYNGYLYVIGGSSATTNLNDVQYAPINANGTIGTWQYTYNSASSGSFVAGFSLTRTGHSVAAYNGYLYVASGWNNTTPFSDVQYAPINANGTIGTWAATTSFNTPRFSQTLTVYNGFMYVLGGTSNGTIVLSDVQYAPINANGTIGTWLSTQSLLSTRRESTTVAYEGHLFVAGGETFGVGRNNAVQYGALNTIKRSAKYSKLVDLGTLQQVTGITYNGTMPGGSNAISYRAAASDGVLGNSGSFGSISQLTPCTSSLPARYLWLTVSLDDTLIGTFADSSGTAANLSDFTITYVTGHPEPSIRLKLGKTLIEGLGQSPLDTCGI